MMVPAGPFPYPLSPALPVVRWWLDRRLVARSTPPAAGSDPGAAGLGASTGSSVALVEGLCQRRLGAPCLWWWLDPVPLAWGRICKGFVYI